MDKITKETCEKKMHNLYCDNCGKYLRTSEEHDYGYFYNPNDISLRFYVGNHWMNFNKTLCYECKESIIDSITNALKNIGFKRT